MTRAARRVALGLGIVAACAAGAGCGDDPTGEKAGATRVAAYLGVPLRGPWGPQGLAVAHGAELGLADSGGGAAGLSLRLSERDVTDDDGVTVGVAGAAREAGVMLRDSGTVAALSGVSAVAVREYGLLAAQTGVAFVSLTGDELRESGADLRPKGRRSAVDLSAPDAAVAAGVVERLGAASCARTVAVDARARNAGAPYDLSAARPVASVRGTSWADPGLRDDVRRALRGGTDCLAVTGDPSAGEPAGLLRSLGPRLRGRTVVLSRGTASQATALLVRSAGLRAEAVVDDVVPGDTAEGRRIDAMHRRWFRTPAPVGAIAGFRGIKLALRAVAQAGPRGNRRDGVADGLTRVRVPGPPVEAAQRPDGTVAASPVSVARAEPYGWRAVRALDPR